MNGNEMDNKIHLTRRSNKKSLWEKWPTGSTDKEMILPRISLIALMHDLLFGAMA